MVQIPGLILDCSKKKPPAKAVVYQTNDALAGFIKRPQVALTRRCLAYINYFSNLSMLNLLVF